MRPEDLDAVWARAAVLLGPALARGLDHTSLGQVREALERREAMLWLVREGREMVAAMVSAIREDKLLVWLLGGRDMDEWAAEVSPLLLRYATEHDLSRVEAHVRPGMTKLLRPLGWRHHQSIVALEVR